MAGDTADPPGKVKALTGAAQALLGDDFRPVPAVTLPPDAAAELANAWSYSTSNSLLQHLAAVPGREFPVDDWLHGVARVRDRMRDWEAVVLLGEALGAAGPFNLIPLQLPYRPGEPWLGLEFPDGTAGPGEHVLYTGHFAEPFDSAKPVCGLLIDEWTEVIPGPDETTGIAFHYDRPNCEPPQAWLLAMVAERGGHWSWDELLSAVNDTIDSAKRRAIEPAHVDQTAYAWFLPATMSAYTFPEISISNYLLRNVRVLDWLARG
jgi:hypothetical protein